MVALVTLGGFVFWYFVSESPSVPEPVACTADAKLCPNGSAVGRVGPNCEFASCPTASPSDDPIIIDYPTPGDTIVSPVTVRGKARGNWFFEASFPVVVVDWDGRIIGEGIATAQDDWMTTEFVPFTATISYTLDPTTPYDRGAVIFRKDNPSGLPQNDDAREIPVTFGELSN